jgi:hypothetical protein
MRKAGVRGFEPKTKRLLTPSHHLFCRRKGRNADYRHGFFFCVCPAGPGNFVASPGKSG